MRILISRLSALGDTVCSLPVAVALKGAFPAAHIAWAVDPRFAGIVERCGAVDEVARVKPGIWPTSWPQFAERFDVALDLQGLAKSALVLARSGAVSRVGYHWQREGAWLASRSVPPDATSFHIVDQYMDVARAIVAEYGGEDVSRASFGLSPEGEDLQKMRSLLRAKEISTGFVLMNAGAGWASKRWPPERFAALADALAARGIPTALIGGKAEGDRAVAREVLAACESAPADLLGETSVRELVALVALARAHVGGDTGSTHLAAALGVPAIGLYSITRPQRSCPYGQIGRCHYDPAGLAHIPANEVLATVSEALS